MHRKAIWQFVLAPVVQVLIDDGGDTAFEVLLFATGFLEDERAWGGRDWQLCLVQGQLVQHVMPKQCDESTKDGK